jgi:hypothetical protein
MVAGFNHNIRYKGELFHVQTEDSGRAKPYIVTLLYRGGTILCSAKTCYADIIKTDQLEMVVESIMKEQHKDMMRRLKGGDLDAKVFPSLSASQPPAEKTASAQAESQPAAPPAASKTASIEPPASSAKRSLDEVILDYLITGEEK